MLPYIEWLNFHFSHPLTHFQIPHKWTTIRGLVRATNDTRKLTISSDHSQQLSKKYFARASVVVTLRQYRECRSDPFPCRPPPVFHPPIDSARQIYAPEWDEGLPATNPLHPDSARGLVLAMEPSGRGPGELGKGGRSATRRHCYSRESRARWTEYTHVQMLVLVPSGLGGCDELN